VVAAVPFVDVINTMLDETLPLTTGEFVEWGNPKIKREYRWMRAYSPYDNLKRGAYPAMLLQTSLNDSQVPYWEPAKVRGAAAHPEDRREPAAAVDQHGCRPRRRLGPLRCAQGACARLRLHAAAVGAGDALTPAGMQKRLPGSVPGSR
jgi:hypothetical protein